jgi:uncharacterized membrane protein
LTTTRLTVVLFLDLRRRKILVKSAIADDGIHPKIEKEQLEYNLFARLSLMNHDHQASID